MKEYIHTILPGDYKPRKLFYDGRDILAFIVGLIVAMLVILIVGGILLGIRL